MAKESEFKVARVETYNENYSRLYYGDSHVCTEKTALVRAIAAQLNDAIWLQKRCAWYQKEIERLKEAMTIIGNKYANATEYYDEIIEGLYVKMPAIAQKFVNQIGQEILQAMETNSRTGSKYR